MSEIDSPADDAAARGFAAQTRAADPAFSTWVSANAGTGKTRVLTDRVARLLLGGTDPQRLLCLTFTRAAAAEMQERLFARLGRWATMPDEALEADLTALLGRATEAERVAARRVFARALEIPGGLKIQTIHAFCEGLLKRFPVEAGVPAHFAVTDEGQAAELLAMARARVLQAVRSGDPAAAAALSVIAESVSETAFQELMAELVAKRNWIARLRRQHGGLAGLCAAIRAHLDVPPGAGPAEVLAAACRDEAFDPRALRAAAAALARGGAEDIARAEGILAFLDAADRPAAFAAYCLCFLTRTNEPRKRLATKPAGLSAEYLAALESEQQRLLRFAEHRRCAVVAQATEAALTLGAALLDAYEAEKRRRSVLDYEDLVLKTRDLLRERADTTWILSKLDSGIDHVLIDEAQDTSPEQWEVIQALTEEFFAGQGAREGLRTVFAVGDEKQSIYGFQGADPRAFGRMRGFFAERVRGARFDWQQEELVLSFRSTPEILDAVDRVFAQPAARDGLSLEAGPIRHSAFRLGHSGLVEIWPTIRPDPRRPFDAWDIPFDPEGGDSPPVLLARRIADTIADWLGDGAPLAPRGRAIRPGDILILVRRRNAFVDAMVRALKRRGIPVAGTDRLVLTDQMAVRDLIALGAFALLPSDDLTLATVLRGPFIGLSEEALFDLAHSRESSLWAALRAAQTPEARAAAAFLSDVLARAGMLSPFDFYSDVLGPLGGRRALAARLGAQANDPIDEFLDSVLGFEALEPPSLQAFLHWIEAAAPEVKRDHEHNRDEVRIMTVHGAKGLEANIVFLADTCAVPNAAHDPKLLPAGPRGDLPLWSARTANDTESCRAAREATRRARDEEHRRLLYVAMTRARDRLYVCGYETAQNRPGHCWYDLILNGLAGACAEVELPFGETGWRLSGVQVARPEDAAPPAAAPGGPAPLPPWAQQPAP